MKLTKQKLEQLIMEQVSARGTEYLADSLSGTIKFWAHGGRGALRPGSHRHAAATQEVIDAFNDTWNARNPIVTNPDGTKRFQNDPEMTALHEQLRDFALFMINNYDRRDVYQKKLKILAMGGTENYIQAADLASSLGLI